MAMPDLETRQVTLTPEDFIADPELFTLLEHAWRKHDWLSLVGLLGIDEAPVGGVLARMTEHGGVTFYWKALPPD